MFRFPIKALAALIACIVSQTVFESIAHGKTSPKQKPDIFMVLEDASENSARNSVDQVSIDFSKKITDLLGVDLNSSLGSFGVEWSTGIIRGEWETAGGMDIPYVPRYRYRYVCQAELSDGQWHSESNANSPYPVRHKIIAVTRFVVDSKRFWLRDFTQLPWVWVKFSHTNQEIINRPKNAISLVGHSIAFWVERGLGDFETDRVNLQTEVSLPVGGYMIPRSTENTVERSANYLESTVEIEGRKLSQAQSSRTATVGRKLFVQCLKQK